MTTSTHFRTCPLCEATCGLEITMDGERVQRIRGDRDDVFSKGFICPKGSTLKQLHEDPDRLRRPLVRKDGVLTEVGWDEAFAAVAEGLGSVLADGDRNAVGVYLGNPNAHNIAGSLFIRPILQALGTKNLYSASTVDQMPKHVSSGWMFGNPGAMPVPDLDRTDYLLLMGANPFESNGSLCTAPDFPGRLAAIRERGGRLVVVDPRRSRTAEEADEHLAIRPGTDAMWLAAVANTIVADHGVDLGDIAAMTRGSDRLENVLAPFSPEAVAAHCRIDPEVTRRIAFELVAAPTAVVYGRIGTHTVRFGTVASWLTDTINVITGNLDRAGGAMFPQPVHGKPPTSRSGGRGFSTGRWGSRVSGMPEVRGELPTAVLAEEITNDGPGRIRALITLAGNPVRSIQDSEGLDAALETLDFMVSVDIYLNETSQHADVVLPPPSPLAKPHFDFAFYGLSVRNVVNYSEPILEPDGPDECEIYARLAMIASGLGPDGDPHQLYDLMLGEVASAATRLEGGPAHGKDPADLVAATEGLPIHERLIDLMVSTGPYQLSIEELRAHPHGIDLGPLEPNLRNVVRTTDAMVDLVPDAIAADLVPLAALLDDDPDDRMLLVGRRHLRSNNSWMHNVEVLVKGRPRCTLQVHPDDATRLGLVDGANARVRSRVGEVEAPVEVTDAIAAGTVSLPHGWGHDAPGARLGVAARYVGVNSNVLTDPAVIDPLSGNGQLNAIPVEVSAA
ncbi:MAG TPA: molybdopterin-dependent oxidoreductase [Microthrixaceae bacterium]|nr:molybdopterin-dependent oxidoreductase [Microthrixaceae bacterium]